MRNRNGLCPINYLTLSMWWWLTHSLKVGALNVAYGGVTQITQVVVAVALLTWELGQLMRYGVVVKSLSISIWWLKSLKSSYVTVVEGKIPCSTVPSSSPWMKAEDGTSSLSSWMKAEDGTTSLSSWMKADVGILLGGRRRCHTSKGEDALMTLGEDAEVVVVVVAPSRWCLSRGMCS